MHRIFLAFLTTIALLAGSAVPSLAESWSCSAPGLVSGSYGGGGSAYIHLTGYGTGNDYPVTRQGNVASGVTKDGTRFTCRMTGSKACRAQ